jgi:hypothetical protein
LAAGTNGAGAAGFLAARGARVLAGTGGLRFTPVDTVVVGLGVTRTGVAATVVVSGFMIDG